VKLEAVAIKRKHYGIRMGSTSQYINIYDNQGRYAGDIKISVQDGVISVTVFHPDEKDSNYSTHHLIGKGPEEFYSRRAPNFTFHDFDWI